MATARKVGKPDIEVTLTGDEAEWLKNYIQNTMFGDEQVEEAELRREVFRALTAAGVE
jgi:hypothetical protein